MEELSSISQVSFSIGHEIAALRAKRSKTQLRHDKHDGAQQTHRRDASMRSFKVKESSHSAELSRVLPVNRQPVSFYPRPGPVSPGPGLCMISKNK